MILDYRIYCTIYALCFVVTYLGMPLAHKSWCRLMCAVLCVALLTGLVNYLDWLWS